MRSKCIDRVVDDDIESPYKIVLDIIDLFLFIVVSIFVSLS